MYENQSLSPTYFKLGAEEITLVFDSASIKVPVCDEALAAFFAEDWQWFHDHEAMKLETDVA